MHSRALFVIDVRALMLPPAEGDGAALVPLVCDAFARLMESLGGCDLHFTFRLFDSLSLADDAASLRRSKNRQFQPFNKSSIDKMVQELGKVVSDVESAGGAQQEEPDSQAVSGTVDLAVSMAMAEAFDAYPSMRESREFVFVASPFPASWNSVKRFFRCTCADHATKVKAWCEKLAKVTRGKHFIWLDVRSLLFIDGEYENDLVEPVLRRFGVRVIPIEKVLHLPASDSELRLATLFSSASQCRSWQLGVVPLDALDGALGDLELSGRVAERGKLPWAASYLFLSQQSSEFVDADFHGILVELLRRKSVAELHPRSDSTLKSRHELFLMPLADGRVIIAQSTLNNQMEWVIGDFLTEKQAAWALALDTTSIQVGLQSAELQPNALLCTPTIRRGDLNPPDILDSSTPARVEANRSIGEAVQVFSTPVVSRGASIGEGMERERAESIDAWSPLVVQPTLQDAPTPVIAHMQTWILREANNSAASCQTIIDRFALAFPEADIRAHVNALFSTAKSDGDHWRYILVCTALFVKYCKSNNANLVQLRMHLSKLSIRSLNYKSESPLFSEYVKDILLRVCESKKMRKTLLQHTEMSPERPAVAASSAYSAGSNAFPRVSCMVSRIPDTSASVAAAAAATANPLLQRDAKEPPAKRPKYPGGGLDPATLNHFTRDRLANPQRIRLEPVAPPQVQPMNKTARPLSQFSNPLSRTRSVSVIGQVVQGTPVGRMIPETPSGANVAASLVPSSVVSSVVAPEALTERATYSQNLVKKKLFI